MKRLLKAIFWIQVVINLIGALGPEISFDALWYHLPIARLIAERGWWGVIPGGLLYTSGAPRLLDFVYGGLLGVGSWMGMESPEVLAKILHLVFGLASAGMIYKLARRYLKELSAWMAVVLWYSNLVVGWQSMVAYVDLARTFFVLGGIWYLLEWLEKGKKRAWMMAGLMLGISYSVKIISGLDVVFIALLLLVKYSKKEWRRIVGYGLIVGLFGLAWGMVNIESGYHFLYPFYGLNTYLSVSFPLRYTHILSPLYVFWHPSFRTGPFVLIALLLGWRARKKKLSSEFLILTVAMFLSWWYAPANLMKGNGRYFLPVLAMLSVWGARSYEVLQKNSSKIILYIVVISGLFGVSYRGYANLKFVPFLIGRESKAEFLAENLNFAYGDWYDVDGEVEKIVGESEYLVVGIHNTYYLPGNYYHESFADASKCYRYIVMKGDVMVSHEWENIYESKETGILYRDKACEVLK